MLLQAYAEATDDTALAARLEPQARAAAEWMLGDGGLAERGWLVYTPDPGGLVNQNWKDSAGAICFADGTQAEGPVAVAEAQGYAYDALVRTARLARGVWGDAPYADRLDALAAGLRDRFHRDFWLPAQDFPALALDGRGRQVDALASDSRPPAVVRDPGPGTRGAHRAAAAHRRLLLRLGRAHAGGRSTAVPPAVVPSRELLAA